MGCGKDEVLSDDGASTMVSVVAAILQGLDLVAMS